MTSLGRVLSVVGFLLGVAVVIRAPLQAQSNSSYHIHLPLVTQKSTGTEDPALYDYVGLLYDYRDNEKVYYTVRGDGSGWTQITEKGVEPALSENSWSPDGRHLVYIDRGDLTILRLSDLQILDQFMLTGRVMWSPDSKSLFLDTGSAVYIYDVPSQTLTKAEFETEPPFLILDFAIWSPDSRYVMWSLYDPTSPDKPLWLWERDTPTPFIHTPDFPLTEPYWSPDGTKFVLNFYSPEASNQVFIVIPSRPGVDLLLDGYSALGWMAGGTRLLVQKEGQLFLSALDGQTVEPFGDPDHNINLMNMGISDTAIIYATQGTQFLYAIGQDNPTVLGEAFCGYGKRSQCVEYYHWKDDETRFLHFYGTYAPAGGWIHFEVGDYTLTPPRYIAELDTNADPNPFLPFSANYLGITFSEKAYPNPSGVNSHIFNARTGSLWRVPYALNGDLYVGEWRYIP